METDLPGARTYYVIVWSDPGRAPAPERPFTLEYAAAPRGAGMLAALGEALLGIVPWLVVLALLVAPFTASWFREWPDRGWAVAKILGLIVAGLVITVAEGLSWFPAERWTLLLLVLLGAILAVGASGGIQLQAALARGSSWNTRVEGLFLATFAGAVSVRMVAPPTDAASWAPDMALFGAFVRATTLPTDDPWWAGEPTPSHPFGYQLWAVVNKLAGTDPWLGYNLAVATVVALTSALVLALVLANLSRNSRARLLALAATVAVVPLLGNLRIAVEAALAFRPLARSPLAAVQSAINSAGAAWMAAAQVIPDAPPADLSTPLPFFWLLEGSLQPSYMALPLLLLVVVVCFALSWGGEPLVFMGLGGVALVALAITNPRDVPIGAVLLGLGYAVGQGRASPQPPTLQRTLLGLFGIAITTALLVWS